MFNINENITTGKYIAVPCALYTNPKYAEVDDTAKIVYSFLISRLKLSQQNSWHDEDGNLYCKASVRELAKHFDTSKSCISRKLIMLEKVGLIFRKQIGWCNADLIFPNKVEDNEDSQNDFSCRPTVPPSDPNLGHAVPQMRPNNNNNITREINVKQQHTDSTTLSNIECAADDTGDVNVVVKLLENFGVTAGAVRKLIHQYPVARIKEVVQVVRERVSAIHNVAGYIYSALKNNYQFTKKQENTTPIVQIVTESDSKGALEEDRSNHTNEPISAPCEPPTEKYVVQERPKVDTESEEKVQSMKDWISRIYKQRGEVVRPLHKWMENHGLRLDENGDVVPAI